MPRYDSEKQIFVQHIDLPAFQADERREEFQTDLLNTLNGIVEVLQDVARELRTANRRAARDDAAREADE